MVHPPWSDARPIFLVGCSRSGTTLLRAMLTCHPGIAIPPESHCIPALVARYGFGPWRQPRDRERAVRFLCATACFPNLGVSAELLSERVLRRPELTAADLFHELFSLYAERFGRKPRWGDKTPPYSLYIPTLHRLFPRAQFIHIIRDGHDVACSMASIPWGGGSLLAAELIWREYVQAAQAAGAALPVSQYREVRYEELVERPAEVLKDLCVYLEEPYADEMLSYERQQIHHVQSEPLRPVGQDRRLAWREALSVRERAVAEYVTGDLRSRLWYETAPISLPLWEKARLRIASTGVRLVVAGLEYLPFRLKVAGVRLLGLLSRFRFVLAHGPGVLALWNDTFAAHLLRDGSARHTNRGLARDDSPWMLHWMIGLALVLSVVAGVWDTWWHGAFGRDGFWEPPHLVLYSGLLVAIVGGVYGWAKTKDRHWRRFAVLALALPLVAPLDSLWHFLFGRENASSPLIYWSPPHVALAAGAAALLVVLLRIIRQSVAARQSRTLAILLWAALLNILWIEAAPVRVRGAFHLVGMWSAGVDVFLFIGFLLLAQRRFAARFAASRVAAAFLGLRIIIGLLAVASLFVRAPSAGDIWSRIVGENARQIVAPPAWGLLVSFVLPAVLLDVLPRSPAWSRGGLAGALMGLFLYGSLLISERTPLGFPLILTAGLSCVGGGVAVGALLSAYAADRRRWKTRAVAGSLHSVPAASVQPFGAPSALS